MSKDSNNEGKCCESNISFYILGGIFISVKELQNLMPNDLSAIKGKKFTRRETDIIACLMCERAISISSFLSISSRTVETHVHNIMLKLECNSRKGIIDFVEQSGKKAFTKAHYQSLAIDVLFERCLEEIAKLTPKHVRLCTIWVKPNESKSRMNVAHKLIKHFKAAGIDAALKKKIADKFTHLDSMTVQIQRLQNQYSLMALDKKEYDLQFLAPGAKSSTQENHIPHNTFFVRLHCLWAGDSVYDGKTSKVNVYDLSDYYSGFLKILQTIYHVHDFEKLISKFNFQRESLLRGDMQYMNDFAVRKQSKSKKLKNQLLTFKHQEKLSKIYELLFRKNVYVVLFSMFFFGCLFLFAGYKKHDTEYGYSTRKYIRSDLQIPSESVLLKRPALLRNIKDHFSPYLSKKPVISVIGLAGAAGSGKTTLARIYAKTLTSAAVVWEINAKTYDSVVDSFKNLAFALAQTKTSKSELLYIQNIQNADEMVKQIIKFVAKHLQRNPNWLLIYDNVESFSNIKNFFLHDVDQCGAGKIIITTRAQDGMFADYINEDSIININALSESEMLTLFTKMAYNTEAYVFSREKEKKLIRFLSSIPPYPLDVSVVSYYIKDSGITCEMYLEQIKEITKFCEDKQSALFKNSNLYEKTRHSIVTLTVKRLIEEEPEFKNLLILLSLIAAENIPKALIESYKGSALANRFISSLKKYAFIKGKVLSKYDDNETFSIHENVQKIIRNFLHETNQMNGVKNEIHVFTNLIQKFSKKSTGII